MHAFFNSCIVTIRPSIRRAKMNAKVFSLENIFTIFVILYINFLIYLSLCCNSIFKNLLFVSTLSLWPGSMREIDLLLSFSVIFIYLLSLASLFIHDCTFFLFTTGISFSIYNFFLHPVLVFLNAVKPTCFEHGARLSLYHGTR